MSIVITVAPTGPIATKADNPALPTSPEEIATAVEQAYHAGAAVAHIHLRDENERPTADPNIARRAMDLIGERCPILIQLSTGVGLTVPFEQREQLVELLADGHAESVLDELRRGRIPQPAASGSSVGGTHAGTGHQTGTGNL